MRDPSKLDTLTSPCSRTHNWSSGWADPRIQEGWEEVWHLVWLICRWDQGVLGRRCISMGKWTNVHLLEAKRMSQDQREGDSKWSAVFLTLTVLCLMREQLQ